MGEAALQQLIEHSAPMAREICRAMQEQVVQLGFAEGEVVIGDPGRASYRLSRDPASGEDSLLGEWRDARGQKLGELTFHFDGSYYAEYDVIRTHPGNERLFVEAVNAWGRDGRISAEPRMLPMVS